MTKEDKVLHLLVKKLGGHSVTIIREGVGELEGFSVGKGRSIAIDDLIAVVHEMEPAPSSQPNLVGLPEGFTQQEIEDMLSIVQDEPQTVDDGGEFGPQESTDGWYARLLRTILKNVEGSRTPSPQQILRGKDEAEMMVDEFEKAFFSRCMVETDARRKAYEAARSGLIAALATEGK